MSECHCGHAGCTGDADARAQGVREGLERAIVFVENDEDRYDIADRIREYLLTPAPKCTLATHGVCHCHPPDPGTDGENL